MKHVAAMLLGVGCVVGAAHPLAAQSVASPPPVYGSQYVGCFADGRPPDLDGPSTALGHPQSCMDFCSGQEFRYAGLRDGRCVCGNKHGGYGPSIACVECPKWPGWHCGAKGATAVWELTGQVTPQVPPTLLPPRRPPPTVR
jgi:hypothetical protein